MSKGKKFVENDYVYLKVKEHNRLYNRPMFIQQINDGSIYAIVVDVETMEQYEAEMMDLELATEEQAETIRQLDFPDMGDWIDLAERVKILSDKSDIILKTITGMMKNQERDPQFLNNAFWADHSKGFKCEDALTDDPEVPHRLELAASREDDEYAQFKEWVLEDDANQGLIIMHSSTGQLGILRSIPEYDKILGMDLCIIEWLTDENLNWIYGFTTSSRYVSIGHPISDIHVFSQIREIDNAREIIARLTDKAQVFNYGFNRNERLIEEFYIGEKGKEGDELYINQIVKAATERESRSRYIITGFSREDDDKVLSRCMINGADRVVFNHNGTYCHDRDRYLPITEDDYEAIETLLYQDQRWRKTNNDEYVIAMRTTAELLDRPYRPIAQKEDHITKAHKMRGMIYFNPFDKDETLYITRRIHDRQHSQPGDLIAVIKLAERDEDDHYQINKHFPHHILTNAYDRTIHHTQLRPATEKMMNDLKDAVGQSDLYPIMYFLIEQMIERTNREISPDIFRSLKKEDWRKKLRVDIKRIVSLNTGSNDRESGWFTDEIMSAINKHIPTE